MAAARRAGQRVVCVTATRGEAADPDRWSPAELAKIREAELAACLALLGVTEHRWLDYPDFACADVDVVEASGRIASIIDEVRPDTVLTFGPDGMTGHPDHSAVSRWTERAVKQSSCAPTLYFATHTPEWVAAFAALGDNLGVMMGADELPRTQKDGLAIDVQLDGELLDLKLQAMQTQASQVADLVRAVGLDRYRAVLREEAFRLP
jgi:LmbE family N-acetylglucosaminyl deacetylase